MKMNIDITEEQFTSLLFQARKNGVADKRFDLNLAEGKLSESRLASILKTVEVKRDFKTSETGNVAIEYACSGEPSGITSTKAKWWALFINEEVCILIQTCKLRDIISQYLGTSRDVSGGDNNQNQMVLVPVIKLTL